MQDIRQVSGIGGIINEKDYTNALVSAEESTAFSELLLRQAENIAKHAGIILDNSSGIDPKAKLYAVLRADNKPKDVKYHHSQMSDQPFIRRSITNVGVR